MEGESLRVAGWTGRSDRAHGAQRVRELVVPAGGSALPPYGDFSTAAAQVLDVLSKRLPFGSWLVNRLEGETLHVVETVGRAYPIRAGDTIPWRDSLCSRMVGRAAPRVAPRVADVPAYVEAAELLGFTIGAYLGVPLGRDDGTLFGTLCAMDPLPRPEAIADELPLVELCGRLLSTVLSAEIRAIEESRRAERAEVDALLDQLTGLVNRRAWERLLAAEEARSRRHGRPACVISVDVDGLKEVNDREGHLAGDLLLVAAARALEQSTREQDVVARVGGDEFAILCVETDASEGVRVVERLGGALTARGVSASIGLAARSPETDLSRAFEAADAAMYDAKRARRRG